jgi:hypothetical protein
MNCFKNMHKCYNVNLNNASHISNKLNSMSGGSQPNLEAFKDINLFTSEYEFDSDFELHLNPLYGLYFNISGAFENYYNFNIKCSSNSFHNIVNSSINKINMIKPNNALFYDNKLKNIKESIHYHDNNLPYHWGYFLASFFLYKKFFKKNVDNFNNIINNITMLLNTLNNFEMKCIVKNINDQNNNNDIKNSINIKSGKKIENLFDICLKIKLKINNIINLIKSNHDNLNKNLNEISDINNCDITHIFNYDITYISNNISKIILSVESYKKCINNKLQYLLNFIQSSKFYSPIYDVIVTKGKFISIIDDINSFHLINSIAWWSFDNKEGIFDYYWGINSALMCFNSYITPISKYYNLLQNQPLLNLNLDYKNKFINNLFDFDKFTSNIASQTFDINSQSFNDLLILHYSKKYGTLPLFLTQRSYFNNHDFADCGETSIRNFLNIITYNNSTHSFDLSILKDLHPIDNLKNYYSKFNTIELQSSLSVQPIVLSNSNLNLNARDAWAYIVSNLPGVTYNDNCSYSSKYQCNEKHNYNIKSGMNINKKIPNMLQVIRHLFNNNVEWSSFNNANKQIELNIKNFKNDDGKGQISFLKYIWNFNDSHFEIIQNVNYDVYNVNNLNNNTVLSKYHKCLLYYLDATFTNFINYDNTNIEFKNKMYFFKYTDSNIMYLLKSQSQSKIPFEISNDCYTSLFTYFDNIFFENIDLQINKYKLTHFNFNWFKYNVNNDTNNMNLFINYDKTKTCENVTKITNCNVLNLNIKKFCNLNSLFFNVNFNKIINENILPNSLKSITFGYDYNSVIKKNVLPSCLESLTFGNNFNNEINIENLINLKSLTFGRAFDQEINVENLINLTSLTFGRAFDQEINVENLINLTSLTFGDKFNQKINSLPCSLTNLTFGYEFNEEINVENLINLTNLTFGYEFNKKINIENLINLRNLTFGHNFDQEIKIDKLINLTSLILGEYFDNKINSKTLQNLTIGSIFYENNSEFMLHNNLTNLTFSYEFNQEIIYNSLPHSLTNLTFGYQFNQEIIDNSLPYSLTNLTFGDNFNKQINIYSLNNLTNLTFGSDFNQEIIIKSLPENLTSLTFGRNFNKKIIANSLPEKLSSLTFGRNFNEQINADLLPKHLSSLTMGNLFNQEIQVNTLPKELTSLTFGNDFDKEVVNNTLPESLTSLTFGYNFNRQIKINSLINLTKLTFDFKFDLPIHDNILPISLTSLTFGYCFNQKIDEPNNSLKNLTNLLSLTFGYRFNQMINANNLPKKLTSLTFGDCFNQPITINELPKSLTNLTFGKYFYQNIDKNKLNTINLNYNTIF